MAKKRVSIIGCGWLGLPLAQKFIQEGFTVKGSTTSKDKLHLLAESGIEPFLLSMEPMPLGENFNQLFDTDLLVINIPPRRKKNPPEFYEEQVKYLKYLILQHKVPKVIFVSSTSFYPNSQDWVTEKTAPDVENGSSRAVVQGEKQIRQIDSDLVILRCGGLMGEGRIPGKWFAGKPTEGASTEVNYIHREDVIGVIMHLARGQNLPNETFNLVCPNHPTRKEVHEAMAEKYRFEKPRWIAPDQISSKKVSGEKRLTTGYQFIHPDPLQF